MATIIITVGPPLAGKSTWAKRFVRTNPEYVRVNRDDLRYMLRSSLKVGQQLEDVITGISSYIILKALFNKKSIVLDNTHCKNKYIEDICSKFPNEEYIVKYFVEPIWKLKLRNILRWIKTGKWIPPHVIDQMDINMRRMDLHQLSEKYNIKEI